MKAAKTGSKNKNRRMVVVGDDFSADDGIGYSKHSAGLVEMIRSVQAGGSFTIGVFGQWGQGKTSMLRQIEKKLIDLDTAGNNGQDILTVWFNPWQFTGEEHIIVPFFHTLAAASKAFEEKKKTAKSKIASKTAAFLQQLADVPTALAYGLEGKIKIPLFLETKFSFKEAAEEGRRRKAKRDEAAKMNSNEALVEKYESLYYSLLSKLHSAAAGMELKIVVFIDDLDRCLPEKAVKLLEGLKVMLDIPGFVFVIGVAREVIERGIRARYRELYREVQSTPLELEEDYLDKIIQFPFTLPPPDKGMLHGMVEDYLEDLKEVKPYLPTIHEALGDNPRSLKRFVNNLSYTFWVAGEEQYRPELLVKTTLLAFVFPSLYQVIGRTPSLLLLIQAYLKDRAKVEHEKKEKIGKAGEEVLEEERSKKVEKSPEEFIPIEKLDLFERPNIDKISAILALETRTVDGKKVKDKGFTSEEEVRDYVRLLAVTAAVEDESESKPVSFREIMERRMKNIPAGEKILMKDERSGNELKTKVKSFLLDKYPVTQDLYKKVMGKNPSHFEGDDRPVESVSWFDAIDFCNRLSDEAGYKRVYTIKGDIVECDWDTNGFRLPSEVEWEHACHGGSSGERYGDIEEIAWYDKNSGSLSQGVGHKRANAWGLFDMLGNVWDWCWDWHGEYPDELKDEWRGHEDGSFRVLRGGSWNDSARYCRASFRSFQVPSDRWYLGGFRLARSL
ncbi:MAG: SUMF1/EgtB/PvdO family nonheme iron enzyme [Candidatus Aminicenantes bacterium]|nr:SUMF1/EgtB/PvdO family nonheme iron enzyme [Candidatus Aminicenantes bacterium]